MAARVAWRLLPLILLCALSACAGGTRVAGSGSVPNYGAPGPASDPWGPYIHEASGRFSVPERWIRAVMRQESGGHEYFHGQPTTSDAGAAGLMQLMPATYEELRARYSLGPDVYDPHDNIMAGTAYIGELYAAYGSPAFLAAYDAGPHRVDQYMAGRGALPNETVNYLASVAPTLGNDRPMSGPLAAYADAGGAPLQPDPVPRAYAPAGVARCWQDPNAAYDPQAPCRPAPRTQLAEVVAATRPGATGWGEGAPMRVAARPVRCWHDPDAAYDPDAPCRPPPAAAPPPSAPPPTRFASNFLIPSAAAATLRPAMATGRWAIQVGAFSNPDEARRMAETVRGMAPRELAGTRPVLGTTSPFGGVVLYRARLLGLSAETAAAACSTLSARRQACVTVPPGA